MGTPHTRTTKGKRVLVILHDGTRLVDRFEERTDRQIRLREKGWVNKSEVRAFVARFKDIKRDGNGVKTR